MVFNKRIVKLRIECDFSFAVYEFVLNGMYIGGGWDLVIFKFYFIFEIIWLRVFEFI